MTEDESKNDDEPEAEAAFSTVPVPVEVPASPSNNIHVGAGSSYERPLSLALPPQQQQENSGVLETSNENESLPPDSTMPPPPSIIVPSSNPQQQQGRMGTGTGATSTTNTEAQILSHHHHPMLIPHTNAEMLIPTATATSPTAITRRMRIPSEGHDDILSTTTTMGGTAGRTTAQPRSPVALTRWGSNNSTSRINNVASPLHGALGHATSRSVPNSPMMMRMTMNQQHHYPINPPLRTSAPGYPYGHSASSSIQPIFPSSTASASTMGDSIMMDPALHPTPLMQQQQSNPFLQHPYYSYANSLSTSPMEEMVSSSERQRWKAMEAASAQERQRARMLEMKEVDCTVPELRVILKQERLRTARIAADLAALRSTAVQSQLEAEVLEEGRINGLMRRVEHLQREKGRIIVELEREEEMLTNNLQKKLNEVKREKNLLEQQIEREKKSHASLQRKLSALRDSHLMVAEALEEQEEMEEED